MEQFSEYSIVWQDDRDVAMETFMKTNPQLAEFEQQINFYRQLDEQFMAEPEYYNVGPIAIFTGS